MMPSRVTSRIIWRQAHSLRLAILPIFFPFIGYSQTERFRLSAAPAAAVGYPMEVVDGHFLLPQHRLTEQQQQNYWNLRKQQPETYEELPLCPLPKGVVGRWLPGASQVPTKPAPPA